MQITRSSVATVKGPADWFTGDWGHHPLAGDYIDAVAAAPAPSRVSANLVHFMPGAELFFSGVHLHGGPAPVRRFLPDLIQRICNRDIDPGKVFDLSLPLEQAAEGYRAMDERRAIKALLRP